MTLIRDLHEAFLGYWQVMASLIVYAIKTIMQIVQYITDMWSVLAERKFLQCRIRYAMAEENAWLINSNFVKAKAL